MTKMLFVGQNPQEYKSFMEYLADDFQIQYVLDLKSTIKALHFFKSQVFFIWDLHNTFEESLEVLKYLRSEPETKNALIFVGQQTHHTQREESFYENGCDLVLYSPFSLRSVQLHLRALIKRSNLNLDSITLGELEFLPSELLIRKDNEEFPLTPTHSKLLSYLCQNLGVLVRREDLQSILWPGEDISPRSIDAHISKLKKVVPELESMIINVYGYGYKLIDPKKSAA